MNESINQLAMVQVVIQSDNKITLTFNSFIHLHAHYFLSSSTNFFKNFVQHRMTLSGQMVPLKVTKTGHMVNPIITMALNTALKFCLELGMTILVRIWKAMCAKSQKVSSTLYLIIICFEIIKKLEGHLACVQRVIWT